MYQGRGLMAIKSHTDTHHDRLKAGDEVTETAAFLDEGLSHGVLLGLLQKVELVIDVLHGEVQALLQVSFAWKITKPFRSWKCKDSSDRYARKGKSW